MFHTLCLWRFGWTRVCPYVIRIRSKCHWIHLESIEMIMRRWTVDKKTIVLKVETINSTQEHCSVMMAKWSELRWVEMKIIIAIIMTCTLYSHIISNQKGRRKFLTQSLNLSVWASFSLSFLSLHQISWPDLKKRRNVFKIQHLIWAKWSFHLNWIIQTNRTTYHTPTRWI